MLSKRVWQATWSHFLAGFQGCSAGRLLASNAEPISALIRPHGPLNPTTASPAASSTAKKIHMWLRPAMPVRPTGIYEVQFNHEPT